MMEPAGNTVSVYGTATAPAANAAIVTIPASSLPAGRYRIDVRCSYGGVAGLLDDMVLKAGATQVMRYILPAVVGSGNVPPMTAYVLLDGSTALSVNAVTGGVALSIYTAQIIATQIRT